MERAAGVLMHISSLPSKYGIGTFGFEAYEFARILHQAGQKYWQILPLGPTGYGDSPYQSFSTFALNPYFIDLDALAEKGLLDLEDYEQLDFGQNPSQISFDKIYENRFPILRKAFAKGRKIYEEDFSHFCEEEHWWLHDYALFMSVKKYFGGKPWNQWDEDIRNRHPEALEHYQKTLFEEIQFWSFLQFLAYVQWRHLKSYINGLEIQIIGDLPIYAAEDSADTWANAASGIFKYDEGMCPSFVAGCPPDYFSKEGQYWGNPVFDWEKNKDTDYSWWRSRIGVSLNLYDCLRIDHFRGLESYWEIPYGAEKATEGAWVMGPGIDFVNTINRCFDKSKIIAEDLGTLSKSCQTFLKESDYPGMRVLLFAFDGEGKNDHLPHNYEKNTIVYTGTHDNDTIKSWWESAEEKTKQRAIRYLQLNRAEGYNRGFIRGAWSSIADLAIVPMQDLFDLGREARMNVPSVLGGNWQWRMKKGEFNVEAIEWLLELTKRYGR